MSKRDFLHEVKENSFLHNLNFLPIPSQDKSLLVLIAFRNQMGDCKHSNAKMGEIFGCDRTSISNQLKRLVSGGYVKVINSGDPHNRLLKITDKTIQILNLS